MSLLKILEENRKGILFAELGALLHDLDKMSYCYFLNKFNEHDLKEKSYREENYNGKNVNVIKAERWIKIVKEPTKYEKLEIRNASIMFEGLNHKGQKIKATIHTTDSNIIASPFIYHHELADVSFPIVSAIVHAGICGADGIDSDLDKTGGTDQNVDKEKGEFFRIDSPFGNFIQRVFKEEEEDKKFNEIIKIINKYCEQIALSNGNAGTIEGKKEIKVVFSEALGGTKYPFNDVTLWAHSYSVATLAKATLAKILIESEYYNDKNDNKNELYPLPARTEIENGNATDFSFLRICFDREALLVRAQKAGDIIGFDEQIKDLKNSVQEYIEESLLIGNEVYRDEDMQLFVIPNLGTWKAKTEIFKDIQDTFEVEVKEKINKYIFDLLKTKKCHEFAYEISFSDLNTSRDTVVAKRILERSNNLLKKNISCKQSPFLLMKIGKDTKNIVDKNNNKGRCPVCNVRYAHEYDFEDSVTNEKEIVKLCKICRDRRIVYTKSREKIPFNSVELGDCLAPGDNKLVLITAQFDLSSIRDGSIFETVNWAKNDGTQARKNPSPGRLYRCWETLESFFKEIVEEVIPNSEEVKNIFIGNSNEDNALAAPTEIKTFRITLSPKTLQFILTAKAAPFVIKKIHELYESQFGKFRNILPLSIGAIFFYHKFPLYAVLDAAKNMKILLAPDLKNEWVVKSNINDPTTSECILSLKPPLVPGFGNGENVVSWKIPTLLSNNRPDTFHPNFQICHSDKDNKHINTIVTADTISVFDGKFDFLLLDSAVRRHAIADDRIVHHVFGKRKPYYVSSISVFKKLEKIIGHLTETQIKHIESSLIEKMFSWKNEWRMAVETNDPGKMKVIKTFCEAVLFSSIAFGGKTIYSELTEEDKGLLISSAVSGLLIDLLDIKLHCASGK